MQHIESIADPRTLFVFDLEFIGDVRKLSTCFIWEIAVFCVQTQQWFEMVVDPDPNQKIFPPPPIPEIPQLTREFLTEHNSSTWDHVFAELLQWVDFQRKGTMPVFVSHNTFRADKPIMELECRRYGLHMPLYWYFFDSLHFSRRVIRNTTGNYSLSGLHQQIFGTGIENAHRARNDVVACVAIMRHLTGDNWILKGPIYPSYCTALRTIRWIGQKAEEILFQANIRSVESLYMLIMDHARKTYMAHFSLEDIIFRLLTNIMLKQLPVDNIKNIAQQLAAPDRCMYCHTFMEPRCDSQSPK